MKKKLILIILMTLSIGACEKDNNREISTTTDLKTENLSFLDSNIPLSFYNDLVFTNEQTGYAISRDGLIIKTTDAGVNWSEYRVPGNLFLKEIEFINPQIGFIIGGDQTGSYLLKTTDAGQNWNLINLNNPENGCPNGLFFKNENEGYIAGNKLFIKTTDGGQTWTDIISENNQDFKDVKFFDPNYGYATLNTGDYYRTSNGGQSWQSIELNRDYHLNEIYFAYGKVFMKSENQLIDIQNNATIRIPNSVSKLTYITDQKSIGIGQHYETGFFPYGDIHLTNNNWNTSVVKNYQPLSEAMDFTAIAQISEHKTMMIGTGQLASKIVVISY